MQYPNVVRKHICPTAVAHSCAKTLASADGGMGGNSILPLNAGLSWMSPRSSCAKHATSMIQRQTCLPVYFDTNGTVSATEVACTHACSMSARALLVVPYTDSLSFCLQVQKGQALQSILLTAAGFYLAPTS